MVTCSDRTHALRWSLADWAIGSSLGSPGGTHANQTVLNITGFLSSLDQCVICPAGTACSVGSAEPAACLPGSYSATAMKEKCDL